MTILAIGSAAAGYMATADAAKKQEAATRQGWEATQAQIGVEQTEINQKATADMSDRGREAMIEQARLATISAESGVQGLSNERLMNASKFNEGYDMARIEGNRERTMRQAGASAKGMHAAAQGKLNTIQQPSLLGAGLTIAGGMVGDYTEAQRVKAIKTSSTKTTR